MSKLIFFVLSLSIFILNTNLKAASGKFDFHTGWMFQPNVINVFENHVIGSGNTVGAAFNNKGQGFLHNGQGMCVVSFEVKDGVGENKGYCSWFDSDGDQIFTSFIGDTFIGINTITVGTGNIQA